MRKIFVAILFLSTCNMGFAQASATTLKFEKEQQPGLLINLPYSPEVAQGAVIQKLKDIGYNPETKGALFWKQRKLDGFYIFKGITLSGMGGQPMDFYFKTTEKSKSSNTPMYLLVRKSDGSFVSAESDSAAFNATRSFLETLPSFSSGYKLGLDIKDQENTISDGDKKLKNLRDKEQDLLKKIDQLQRDLAENKTQQETQVKFLEDARKKLEELRLTKL